MLTAAASVVITCGVVIRDVQLSRGLQQARQQNTLQDRLADDLKKQLDEARNEHFQVSEALERARAATAPLDRPSALALPALGTAIAARPTILFPQTRSLGQPPTVSVSQSSSISLDLRLESDEFPQYCAVLRHPASNRIVWRSALLSARPGKPAAVPVVIPANVLEARHYTIELAGVNAAGLETTISSYAFQIDWRARVP